MKLDTKEHQTVWQSLKFQASRDNCWAAWDWGWLWLLAVVQHHPENLLLDPRQVCWHIHRLCSGLPTLQIWELQVRNFHSLLCLSSRLGPCFRWDKHRCPQTESFLCFFSQYDFIQRTIQFVEIKIGTIKVSVTLSGFSYWGLLHKREGDGERRKEITCQRLAK